MFLKSGDIIVVKNTIFKDNGLCDSRPHGHPAIVLDASGEMLYYSTISSRENQYVDFYQYYHYLSEADNIYHKHEGYVNCKNIYRREVRFHYVCDSLSAWDLEVFMYKFIHYQENFSEDEFYGEIKEKVKQYIR